MFFVIISFILVVIGLTWYLLAHDRGAKEPPGALWAAFGFGVIALIIAAALEAQVLPGLLPSVSLEATLLAMMLVGLIEEAAKFLPLAIFIYRKPYFNEHTDGVLYFAICGLAFGLIENIYYTLSYGALAGEVRIVLVPFFHAAGAGIVGYYLSRAKLAGKSWWSPVVALAAMAGIHGLYDFGLYSKVLPLVLLSILITIMLSLSLFLYFMRAGELDRKLGLSASGKNKFCRACGLRNSSKTLYCEACGNPA